MLSHAGAAVAGKRRGRKRRLDSPGAAAAEAEGADAQQPERKRHRLATASRSASPMSEAPEVTSSHTPRRLIPCQRHASMQHGNVHDGARSRSEPFETRDPTGIIGHGHPQLTTSTASSQIAACVQAHCD